MTETLREQVDANVVDVLERRIAESRAQQEDYDALKTKVAQYEQRERDTALENAGFENIADLRTLYGDEADATGDELATFVEKVRKERPYLLKDGKGATELPTSYQQKLNELREKAKSGRMVDRIAFEKFRKQLQQ